MNQELQKTLHNTATTIRLGALEGVYNASSGHPGGSLSIAEILAYLYFKEMHIDPKNPKDPDRDRFVLSKGHCAPALYAALALRGYFPTEDLKTLRHIDSYLQGHPDMKHIPGIDMSTGSLGLGISAACGMALGAKLDNASWRVYTILGDGEIEEGQVWEAAMFAAHYRLSNLLAFVDVNGLQIDGATKDVMNSAPLTEKFAAFGWHVINIDAHSLEAIETACEEAKTVTDRPTVILAHSVKGKGVSFMENAVNWHGAAPKKEQYELAVAELNQQFWN